MYFDLIDLLALFGVYAGIIFLGREDSPTKKITQGMRLSMSLES